MGNSTIVAQATPSGRSGVAVIRISGPNAFLYAKKLSQFSKKTPHHTVRLLPIYDSNQQVIDKAIFTFFKSPRSYTGEDVVEISCHGNPHISESIIETIRSLGASMAEPGEYTKRAFLNGKMDLSQAESVALLISSRSKDAALHQLNNINGAISKKIKTIRKELMLSLSSLEFELDVSEDIDTLKTTIRKSLKYINNNILHVNALVRSHARGSVYSSGIRVVIAGAPNVGKSTLSNRLLGADRSIVNKTAGTTRDTISAEITIAGAPITIVDTAGIRPTSNKTEEAGVNRAVSEIARSNLVLSVFTHKTQAIDNIEDSERIMVYNKEDEKKYSGSDKNVIAVSALKNTGIKKLFSAIEKKINSALPYSEDTLINTERQKSALEDCLVFLNKSKEHLESGGASLELATVDIRSAIDSLDAFLGKVTTEDILDQVFSSFCVGK